MSYKRILTIQDISCVGQCSLTVALPILSSCKIETCILPSAVLSTHTAGFSGFTFRDLTDDMPLIEKHWQKENIKFEAIYTGYLGSVKQIEYVKSIMKTSGTDNMLSIVDPAMADNGKLYPLFDEKYVQAMKKLCFEADIILPNITEACYLTDCEYKEVYTEDYIGEILKKLVNCGAKTIILTGVSLYENGNCSYYEHRKIKRICHGTGDVYASAFTGAYLNGKSSLESAKIAADYTVACIENTLDDPGHWYGVKFETALDMLSDMIK